MKERVAVKRPFFAIPTFHLCFGMLKIGFFCVKTVIQFAAAAKNIYLCSG